MQIFAPSVTYGALSVKKGGGKPFKSSTTAVFYFWISQREL
jgi:hypothetical protein